MSQPDPRPKQAKPQASSQKPPESAKPPASKKPASAKSGAGPAIVAVLVVVVLALAATALWFSRSSDTPPPVVSADVENDGGFEVVTEPIEEAEEAEEVASEVEGEDEGGGEASTPAAPARGSLVINSDVKGADVYLNGKRVGKTPHKATPLKPGTYQLKVEKAGYEPFEQKVEVAASESVVTASLSRAAATLRIDSNVAGATVFVDGEDRGTTPLELRDLAPGSHALTVSADGYETHKETIELESGRRDLKIELASPSVVLNEAVAVKHKHHFGSCEGVLRADSSGIDYDSTHKDAFHVAFADLEQFEVDGDNLNLKVLDGRNYNFEERNDNPDALVSFHDRVAEALQQASQEKR